MIRMYDKRKLNPTCEQCKANHYGIDVQCDIKLE